MNKFESGRADFGNTEAEQMGRNFIKLNFDFVERVEPASDYDDRKAETKFDHTVYAGGGVFLGIQQKFSSSPERAKEAIKMILARPLAQLHDNEGNVVSPEKFPVVLIHSDIKEWGEAYNQFLAKHVDDPLLALKNTSALKQRFLEQMLECLKLEKYYFPQYSEIFDVRSQVLETELSRLKGNKKAANRKG